MTTDTELVRSTAQGDRQAFEQLYQRHHDRLLAAIRPACGQDAEDALQNAMVRVWQSAGTFRGDSQVSTWLYRIAVNACLDIVRRRARYVGLDRVPELGYEPWRIYQVMRRQDIRRCWTHLTRDQQEAVFLRDIMDLPVDQAAERAGVSEGTIKSRAHRGHQILARCLPRKPTHPSLRV